MEEKGVGVSRNNASLRPAEVCRVLAPSSAHHPSAGHSLIEFFSRHPVIKQALEITVFVICGAGYFMAAILVPEVFIPAFMGYIFAFVLFSVLILEDDTGFFNCNWFKKEYMYAVAMFFGFLLFQVYIYLVIYWPALYDFIMALNTALILMLSIYCFTMILGEKIDDERNGGENNGND